MAERFKDARMLPATPANTIDSHTQDLEDAVVYMFGLPVNTDLDGQVFTINEHGIITGIFTSAIQALPGSGTGPGWRIMDITTGEETDMLIMVKNNKLRFYDNTGTSESPVWTERNSIDALTGEFGSGGRMLSGTGASGVTGPADFTTGEFVQFTNEAWAEEDATQGIEWTSGQRTRFIALVDGLFQFNFTVGILGNPGDSFIKVAIGGFLSVNGAASPPTNSHLYFYSGQASWTDLAGWVGMSGSGIIELSATDYVSLNITTDSDAGDDYTGYLSRARMDAIMVGYS